MGYAKGKRRRDSRSFRRFLRRFVALARPSALWLARRLAPWPLSRRRLALAATQQSGRHAAARPSGIRHPASWQYGNTYTSSQVRIRLEVKKYASMFLSILKPQFDNLSSLFILYLVCTYCNPIYQFFVILCNMSRVPIIRSINS